MGVKIMYFLTLEDRIYCLLRTSMLPTDLKSLLEQAEAAYLEECDEIAVKLVIRIENSCKQRGIEIYTPQLLVNCG